MHGCTSEEIRHLEVGLRLHLPKAYREFLSQCGKGAGKFLVGTDWTFAKLTGVQQDAVKLASSCGIDGLLPLHAFVFAMHQGYQFLYFDCDQSDDPPVMLFLEGEGSPRQVSGSFTQWLSQCIVDEAAAHSRLG